MGFFFFSGTLSAQNSKSNTLDLPYENLSLQSHFIRPSLLLVDNDRSFDNKGFKINCVEDESAEQKYSRLLEDLGYTFIRYRMPSLGEGPDIAFMQNFDAVVWVMGDNAELGPEERTHIADYLENGGRFLILFPNFIFDPNTPFNFDLNTPFPNQSISDFFRTYLGISKGSTYSITPSVIQGVSGTIMDSVNTSAKSDWVDGWSPMGDIADKAFVVNPVEEAEGLIHSWNTEYPYIAVAYEPPSETMEDLKKWRSIFFGFELTFVSDYEARQDIMRKALNWLIRLRVAATSLGDGHTEIPCHIPIRITFNKSMDLTLLTQPGTVIVDPVIPITLSLWDKHTTLELRPNSTWNSGNWTPGVEHTITINNSCALDDSGQTLSLPFQLSFTGNAETDATVPEVISLYPPDGAMDISHEQDIEIIFNAPLDPTSINSRAFCVTQGEELIPGHFCYLKDENKIVFSPHKVFISGRTVLVTLNDDNVSYDSSLKGINGTSVKNFRAGFTVRKPEVTISDYVLKKGYQLISAVQPGMNCTMELTLKNMNLSPVEGMMVIMKPVSDNIYPHYQNKLGITTYGHFDAHQEKCEDFSFTLCSDSASLEEKVVFDVYSSDNFNSLWKDPNHLWPDSNNIWQDSNNVWRERISFSITGTDETPPDLNSSFITITPIRGIQQGTQIHLSAYVDEPGELGEVKAEFCSLDHELRASIPLHDLDGDYFYEGNWIVDSEGYYYVNVKAEDASGNMSELEKAIYFQSQKFQSSAPFLVVYDYDSPLGRESLKQLLAWKQIFIQTSFDFDFYVTGCEYDITYDILSRYNTVIWIIPQNSTGFCLNKAVEIIQDLNQEKVIQYPIQNEIIQYLDSGGNLLIAGKDVSSYFIRYSEFYLDYLHAVYVQEIFLQTIIPAENTHPISGGIYLYRQEGMADEIDPAPDGNSLVEPVYFYSGNTLSSGTAALRVITDTYDALYFAFDLEGLWIKENIVELLRRSLVRLSPPLVTAVNPQEGSVNVSLNSRIAVLFSEKIDTESVNACFTIQPPLPGNIFWDEEGRCLMYDYESGQLSPETMYTITIGNSVFDRDADTMQEAFSWAFTTGVETDTTPPALSIKPEAGSSNVPSDTDIEILFSEPMDITTLERAKLKVTGSFSGQIEGNSFYDFDVSKGKWKLTFDPYKELVSGEQITIHAGDGWKDAAGHDLMDEVSSFFTVTHSNQVYVVSCFPDSLEHGKFYSYFSLYIKNDSGADLYDVKASIETSSEWMNQPYPIAYNPFIEMEATCGWIGQGEIQNFYFSFYTPSECPDSMNCFQDIQIPCVIRLNDGEGREWADSFTLTLRSSDKTPPEIVTIETDQDNSYVPIDEKITIRSFIKEPGQVTVKASFFSDSLSAADEIYLTDPDNDRVFTGTYTPQCEADYWLNLKATDAAQNITIMEKALWFTSKSFDPDPQNKILVIVDYPKTGPPFDNYMSIVNSYLDALEEGGYRHQYCLWETDVYGNIGKDIMIQYDLIIWIIPYSFYSYYQGLRDISVQNSLMEYLDQGGNLLIAGDGSSQIYSQDNLLYSDYFYAEYRGHFDYGYDGTLLLAEENDPISHNHNVYLQGSYYYHSAQVITPREKNEEEADEESPEVKVLYTYDEYSEHEAGAAALRVTAQNYRLVYFAFDFDKIQSKDDRSEIVIRSLAWLYPPAILSVNPINGSGDVAQNSTLSLYFNKQMDTESVESAFHIDPYVSGTFTWDTEQRHLVYDYRNINPDNKLLPNTTYTITLENTASDQGGQNMTEDCSWSFTTGEFIDTASPTLFVKPDPNTAVPADRSIEVIFVECMDRTSIDREKLQVIGSVSGHIDGHITYDYDDESGMWKLTFDPDKNFIGREQITVMAGEGWKDAAGNLLTGETSSSFSVIRPDVYVVSFSPQYLRPGKFYSDFKLTIKNSSGFDLNTVKATLTTSSEFVNFPYPLIYSSYINMENIFWNIEYDSNNLNGTTDLYFDFYLCSDCLEEIDCFEDIQIPFVLHLTDEEQNIWSDSFILPLVESDTDSPKLLRITKSDPDSSFVPLNEEVTLYCFIKEPGWVDVKAYMFSDPNVTCTFSDFDSNHYSAIDEIQLCDPDHDRIFTGTCTPHNETDYWITIEATDLAGNRTLVEKALQFTSIPFVSDPGANILAVFDYPKTESQDDGFDNYVRILTRYLTGLNAGGYRYDVWEIDIYGNLTTDILNDYDAVIWIKPRYYSYYHPHYLDKGLANSAVQNNLMDYLDEGGNLLLAGQGTTDYTMINSTLYSNYLHAKPGEYFYYSFSDTLLSGVENDPISHDLNVYLETENYYETFAQTIIPDEKSQDGEDDQLEEESEVKVMYTYEEYPGQGPGAAALRVTTEDYRLVYFAFDLDTIQSTDDLITVIIKSTDWLCSPFIVSVNPVDGLTDVPQNSTISIYFNKGMNPADVESAFVMNPYHTGTFIWDSEARHLTYEYRKNDSDLLFPDTEYRVTINNSASDLNGENMKRVYEWSFTTGAYKDDICPTLSIIPSDPNVEVSSDSTIQMVFGKQMDRTTIDKEKPLVVGSASGPIQGQTVYGYDDQLEAWKLTFYPYNGFVGREQITVMAGEGWKDVAGHELWDEVSSSFPVIRSDIYIVSFDPNIVEPGKFYRDYPVTIKNESGLNLYELRATLESFSECVNQPYRFVYKADHTMKDTFWNFQADQARDFHFDFYVRSECSEIVSPQNKQIPFILRLTDEANTIWSDCFFVSLDEFDTTHPEIGEITKEQDNFYIPGKSLDPNGGITINCFIKEPGPMKEVKAYISSYSDSMCNADPDSMCDELLLSDRDNDRVFTGTYIPVDEAEYYVTFKAVDLAENTAIIQDGLWFTSKPFMPDSETGILLVFDYPKTTSLYTYDTILRKYEDSLQAIGYGYDLWEIDVYGNITGEILNHYDMVIWIKPDYDNYYEHYQDKGLVNASVQEDLTAYLDKGGNLLIAGKGTMLSSIYTSTFYNDYLHAEYSDYFDYGYNSTKLSAQENDPVSCGLDLYLRSIESYNYADVIDPIYTAPGEETKVEVLYIYDQYSGEASGTAALSVSAPVYKLVYFAFDLESLDKAKNRTQIIEKSLEWLSPSSLFSSGIQQCTWTFFHTTDSYTFLRKFGRFVSAVQRIKSDSGRCETTYSLWGKPTGDNFLIVPGKTYTLSVTSPFTLTFHDLYPKL